MTGRDAGGPPDEQLARTWIAAQDLRLILSCPDRARAELARLARTRGSWRAELLAYVDTGGVSNGPTEAIDLLIKKIRRVGHGFHNLDKTTGSAYCCTAALTGTPSAPPRSEVGYHAWWRRAGYRFGA